MQTFLKALKTQVDKNAATVSIYSTQTSNRLQHVCTFIFEQVLGLNYELLTNESDFVNRKGLKINYSELDFENCYKILPTSFIFETSVNSSTHYLLKKNEHWQIIQKNKNTTTDYALDFFSAVFYFISRYEEWQAQELDEHGRFEIKSSILYKHQLHLKPIIDIWISDFKKAIQQFYPNIKLPNQQFKIISTIDIDNVFAYKSKGTIRTIGAYFKDAFKFNFIGLKHRTQVLFFGKKDPFDIYDSISRFCSENQIPLIYFFLFRTGTKNDRTLPFKSPAFKNVFETIKKSNAIIALHPSYDAAFEKGLLENEKQNLEEMSNQSILFSRQHFLRFNIKSTPQLLIKNGIMADFTMGFASSPGFRAGTSYPFYYYDFKTESTSQLLMVPFCAMDGAYTVYKLSPANEALQSMLELANEIKAVGGYFITVYHERSFYNHLYKDYGDLYKNLFLKLKGRSE